MALGKRIAGVALNHIFGKSPSTSPAGVLYVSLHTTDPGVDGQGGGEATGTNYARVQTAATDWNAATDADPTVITNAEDISFPQAGGDWSTGSDFTYIGIWAHATTSTEAEFVGRAPLATAKAVLEDDTLTLEAGDVAVNLDVTP